MIKKKYRGSFKVKRGPLFYIISYLSMLIGVYIVLLGILMYMRYGLDTEMTNEFMFKLPIFLSIGTVFVGMIMTIRNNIIAWRKKNRRKKSTKSA